MDIGRTAGMTVEGGGAQDTEMKLSHGLDTAIGKPVFNSNSNSEGASFIHNQKNYHSTVPFFPVPYRLLPRINLHSNFNPHIKTHLSPIPTSQTPTPNPSFPNSLHDQALNALSILLPQMTYPLMAQISIPHSQRPQH